MTEILPIEESCISKTKSDFENTVEVTNRSKFNQQKSQKKEF